MLGMFAKISLILVGHTNKEEKKKNSELQINLPQDNFTLLQHNISNKKLEMSYRQSPQNNTISDCQALTVCLMNNLRLSEWYKYSK